jgi:hypothetical protein
MEPRERNREGRRREQESSGTASSNQSLSDQRQAGSDLLAAADEAIRRALSGDSEAFLSANRQEGGQ